MSAVLVPSFQPHRVRCSACEGAGECVQALGGDALSPTGAPPRESVATCRPCSGTGETLAKCYLCEVEIPEAARCVKLPTVRHRWSGLEVERFQCSECWDAEQIEIAATVARERAAAVVA